MNLGEKKYVEQMEEIVKFLYQSLISHSILHITWLLIEYIIECFPMFI